MHSWISATHGGALTIGVGFWDISEYSNIGIIEDSDSSSGIWISNCTCTYKCLLMCHNCSMVVDVARC